MDEVEGHRGRRPDEIVEPVHEAGERRDTDDTERGLGTGGQDWKSTRLTSSHTPFSLLQAFFVMVGRPPSPTLFPCPTLFRSRCDGRTGARSRRTARHGRYRTGARDWRSSARCSPRREPGGRKEGGGGGGPGPP